MLTDPPALTMWSSLRLALILIFLCTEALGRRTLRGCFSEDELASIRPVNRLRRSIRTAELRSGAVDARTCSDFKHLSYSPELRNRALSPWRSIVKTNHSLIPSVYEEAECLCSGCIINGTTENTDYNSVPVVQRFMFLKKVSCATNPTKYSLKVVYKEVKVACTCVVPRQ